MEEYIKKLLEQVRFKKAHRGIAEEIRAHIEDQIEDNMAAGMDREAAEKAAVEDMGDPVEVGISMDRVHRPQIAWQMVLGAVVVGIIGSIIHILLAKFYKPKSYYAYNNCNNSLDDVRFGCFFFFNLRE